MSPEQMSWNQKSTSLLHFASLCLSFFTVFLLSLSLSCCLYLPMCLSLPVWLALFLFCLFFISLSLSVFRLYFLYVPWYLAMCACVCMSALCLFLPNSLYIPPFFVGFYDFLCLFLFDITLCPICLPFHLPLFLFLYLSLFVCVCAFKIATWFLSLSPFLFLSFSLSVSLPAMYISLYRSIIPM